MLSQGIFLKWMCQECTGWMILFKHGSTCTSKICRIMSTNVRNRTVIVAIKCGNPCNELVFFSFSDPLDPALRFLQLAL